MKPKTYSKNEIRKRISTDPRWARRAVLALYKKQTYLEQESGRTNASNGVGFNAFDAPFLTKFAKAFQNGQDISANEWFDLKRRVAKYAGQLFRISQGKAA